MTQAARIGGWALGAELEVGGVGRSFWARVLNPNWSSALGEQQGRVVVAVDSFAGGCIWSPSEAGAMNTQEAGGECISFSCREPKWSGQIGEREEPPALPVGP